MFDGDKLLVCNHPTLINAAERINKKHNVVPLFYFMGKAAAEELNCENIYHGLVRAFTGGNIGAPSNDITKIWNSGDITDESIKSAKWLVMQVNYIIDYAKTLYKPSTPNDVELTLSQFTKAKVPHFFKYAKKKTDSQIEDANYSVVNRVEFLFPQKKLNYNFSQSNLGRFD